jgi:Tol biopolymer transport system component
VVVIRFRVSAGVVLVAVVVLVAAIAVGRRADAAVPRTTLVSSSAAGAGGNGASLMASVSGDGTLVAFASNATNLDPRDPHPWSDVYVKNVTTGAVQLVSVAAGSGARAGGSEPAISADGRYVAFTSGSANLVAGDTNDESDVFVRDLSTGTTALASLNDSGDQTDAASGSPAISGDGRYVAFVSMGRNMPDSTFVPGPGWGGMDVYLRDMVAGTTVRVSRAAADPTTGGNNLSFYPDISDDGRFVAYASVADNLVTVPDTNQDIDVFWWDRLGLSPPMRVSVAGFNTQGTGPSNHPSISANGRYVAFDSAAPNFGGTGAQVYVRDVTTMTTQQVSTSSQGFRANRYSQFPAISGDGRYVTFASDATNLVANDTNARGDVFVRDRTAKVTVRVSLTDAGAHANDHSHHPDISPDGTHVAFTSGATGLVANDGNGRGFDVFIAPAGAPPHEPEPPTQPAQPARQAIGAGGPYRGSHGAG